MIYAFINLNIKIFSEAIFSFIKLILFFELHFRLLFFLIILILSQGFFYIFWYEINEINIIKIFFENLMKLYDFICCLYLFLSFFFFIYHYLNYKPLESHENLDLLELESNIFLILFFLYNFENFINLVILMTTFIVITIVSKFVDRKNIQPRRPIYLTNHVDITSAELKKLQKFLVANPSIKVKCSNVQM